MKVVFDLSSVKVGGGVEQSIVVLSHLLPLIDAQRTHARFIVVQGSIIHRFLDDRQVALLAVSGVAWRRLILENWRIRKYLLDDVPNCVFTFFGIGLPRAGSWKAVVNIAYPILCYPDSQFWNFLPTPRKIVIRLKCLLRLSMLRRRSDVVIVETDLMRRRLASFAKLPLASIKVLPPAYGAVAQQLCKSRQEVDRRSRKSNCRETMRVLFVSGTDYHKNLWRLPDVARLLSSDAELRGRIVFVITTGREAFTRHCTQMGVDSNGVAEYFEFLGKSFDKELIAAIQSASVYANLSDLESVSNNFIEAASWDCPMLIAERDFALQCCRVPFVACEPHDPYSILDAIRRAFNQIFELPVRAKTSLAVPGSKRAAMIIEEMRHACNQS